MEIKLHTTLKKLPIRPKSHMPFILIFYLIIYVQKPSIATFKKIKQKQNKTKIKFIR